MFLSTSVKEAKNPISWQKYHQKTIYMNYLSNGIFEISGGTTERGAADSRNSGNFSIFGRIVQIIKQVIIIRIK